MATKTTTYTNVKGLYRALSTLPKEASAQLREASKDIASAIAMEAAEKARSQGGAAGLVAKSIKAKRDRVPSVRMGSPTKLPTSGDGWTHSRSGSGQTIGDVIWGAEFGGQAWPTTQQFLPHLGRTGYFLWPTVRERSDETQARYSEALNDALQKVK